MTYYELSVPLRPEHPAWPDDPPFSRRNISSIPDGGSCNVSLLTMTSHYGTHMDAPYHFEMDGGKIHEIPLETIIGKTLVHETGAEGLILPGHLPPLDDVDRILFKTSNSEFVDDTAFHKDYVAVGLEAARELVQAGVKLIGIDYFSIEAFKAPGHPVHHELCGNGVILLEGVNLRRVTPGWYELFALPLNIEGCDGSPCRAVLRDLK